MDVNTLQIGVQGSSSANSGNNFATGTVNINGGTLVVNSSLQLGSTAGGGGASSTRGALNISSGTVRANSLSTGAGTNNSITLNGGALFLTNAVGPGLNTLAVTNATLFLSVTTNAPSLHVTNLFTGGANAIHILSLPSITSNPAQFPIVKYSGAIGGAGFNFHLGTMPPTVSCGAYLSNNLAAGSVDLVLINCVTPDPKPVITDVWRDGETLVLSGGAGIPNAPYFVLTTTNVAAPVAQWERIASNVFTGSGGFSFSNVLSGPQRFYRLQLP
jgi:hypothetical protein